MFLWWRMNREDTWKILISAGVDEIWRRTQVPDLHQQWDLRFTTIDYRPRHSDAEPQKFLHSTRVGFGLKINGEGASTGIREDLTGVRTSVLDLVRLPDSLWTRRPVTRPAPVPAPHRLGIAFTWMWQGLVPKLVFSSIDEKTLLLATGLPLALLPAIGALELAFAALTLCLWRWRRAPCSSRRSNRPCSRRPPALA
jgi:hypothetical protein